MSLKLNRMGIFGGMEGQDALDQQSVYSHVFVIPWPEHKGSSHMWQISSNPMPQVFCWLPVGYKKELGGKVAFL